MSTIWPDHLPQGAGPKYRGVVDLIRGVIGSAELVAGDKLPPVRDLAWRLKITPGTVARAYTILTDEGVLVAEVGRGTFVAASDAFGTAADDALIEMDVVTHNRTNARTTESYGVNLFSPALPNVGQADFLRNALARVARDPASGMMHYPTRAAQEPARQAALAWLADTQLGPLAQDDLVLTLGGQNGIMLVLQAILDGRRPTILVEELAYPGFRRAADLLRVDVVAVPMDAQGVIPDALAEIAASHGAQALLTSPEVHNPTLTFTPLERRQKIAEVARTQGMQIVEDDCYRMGPTAAPSYRMLAPDLGWFVSSVAKTLTPALRLGCAVAPQDQTGRLRRAVEHGFFGLPTPLTDLAALVLGDPQVKKMAHEAAAIYGRYIATARDVLAGYELVTNDNVPFMWLTLPKGWRATAFCQAAASQEVLIRSAEEFAGREARAPHAVRIAINAGHGIASFKAAIQRLRGLLDNPQEQIGI